MARSRIARIALLAAALAAFVAAILVPGLDAGVLFLSPAIVLLASLLTGRYVGEERLRRLAATVRPRRRRARNAAATPAVRRHGAVMPRGGRLVATSLAVRPPPRPLPAR